MSLKITKFPHAEYNHDDLIGFLCEYYAYPIGQQIITQTQWRNDSWSGSVLDYKDGTDAGIQFFLKPYMALVEHVVRKHSADYAYVVPVPASVPEDDPAYRRTPKTQRGESRDDRNDVFCELLHDNHDYLINARILKRADAKPKKVRWSPEQHAASMRIRTNKVDISDGSIIVLVDDVTTAGGTIYGAKQLLSERFDPDQIVMLPIAKTRTVLDFRSKNESG
jgi:hypothetical protein